MPFQLQDYFNLGKYKQKLTINGTPYSNKELQNALPSLLVKIQPQTDEVRDLRDLRDLNPPAYALTITEIYNKALMEMETTLSEGQEERDVSQVDLLNTYFPVRNILTNDAYLIAHGDKRVSTIPFDTYRAVLTPKEWNAELKKVQLAYLDYYIDEIPQQEYILVKGVRKYYPAYSTYIPPEWLTLPDKKEPLHPDHRTMIETRFAGANSVERFFCVLYHMLTSRSKVFCGLVDKAEGTGKSMTLGDIPAALVGVSNLGVADSDFVTTPHKDMFLCSRAIILNEHRVSKAHTSVVKQWVENHIPVNPKNKTARKIANRISFFMTSNNYEDIYTEPANRRHYFLEDSGRSIVEEQGIEWVVNYATRLLEDHAFVANLGYYILNEFKNPKYPANPIYRGPTFEKVVRATCFHAYEELAITPLLDKGNSNSIRYSEIKKKYNRTRGKGDCYFPRLTAFKSFFKHFKMKGAPICTIEEKDKDIILTPL